MTVPRRIQQRRTLGWRMPEGAVSVARPSKHGNPWRVRHARVRPDAGPSFQPDRPWRVWVNVSTIPTAYFATEEQATRFAVAMFRRALIAGGLKVTVEDVRRELAGLDLACWCPLGAAWCHADVLLEVANDG